MVSGQLVELWCIPRSWDSPGLDAATQLMSDAPQLHHQPHPFIYSTHELFPRSTKVHIPTVAMTEETKPQIHTYHCLCTTLVLATTTPLSSLPRRQNSALDTAYILPLPSASDSTSGHHAVLQSAILDPKAQVVKTDQGFEKRYLQRCKRCRLVVGYQLDWQQFGGERLGRREDVVYLLPGGFTTTDEMVEGKDMESQIGFEGVAGTA